MLVALGLVVVVLDWSQLRQVIVRANWGLVLPALAFTTVSYACLSLSFATICRVFGVRLGRRDLFEIGFVSWALNHLVASGGAAGYSLRMLLIKRRGLPVRDVLAASLFHSALNNLALFLLAPAGLVLLFLTHPSGGGAARALALASGLLLVLLVVFWVLLFVGRVRNVTLRVAGGAWQRITHHDISARLTNLDATMNRGVLAVRRRPKLITLPVTLVFLDWMASAATLWFCFAALGTVVRPGVLLTGFVTGVAAGLVSMVPGGLGVQDGSMAAVYALLGVPLRSAILAVVLFRLVYYIVPFMISLLFYRRLLEEAGGEIPEPNYVGESGS